MTAPALANHPAYDPAIPAKQAAAYISVHYRTLLDLTRDGKIVALRSPGGRITYRLSDLNGYLDEIRQASKVRRAPKEIDWGI